MLGMFPSSSYYYPLLGAPFFQISSSTFAPHLVDIVTTSTASVMGSFDTENENHFHVLSPGHRVGSLPATLRARRFADHPPDAAGEWLLRTRLGREYGQDSVSVQNLHELLVFCDIFRRTHEHGAPPVFKFVLARGKRGLQLFVGRVVRPADLGKGLVTVDHRTIARKADPKNVVIAGFGGFDEEGRFVVSVLPSTYYIDAVPRKDNVAALAAFLGGNVQVWFARNPEDPYYRFFHEFLAWYQQLLR